MAETDEKVWWGAAEGEREDASWQTGSEVKQERIDRYVEWLLTPRGLRQPPSKTKLAAELGVTPQTLRNYDKDPLFQKRLVGESRGLARVDKLPDILESLYQQATDILNPRSVAAAKALLDHVEKLAPQSEKEAVDVTQMDTEALANLAVQLLQRINE